MNDFKEPNKTIQRILEKHKLNFFGTRRVGNLLSNNEGNKGFNEKYTKINNKGYKIERITSGEKTTAAKLSINNKRYNDRNNNRYNDRYDPKKI
jgi:hypothetical protein